MNRYRSGLDGVARLMQDKATERSDPFMFEVSQYLQHVAQRHQPVSQDEQTCVTCSSHGQCEDYSLAYCLAVTWLMDQVEG